MAMALMIPAILLPALGGLLLPRYFKGTVLKIAITCLLGLTLLINITLCLFGAGEGVMWRMGAGLCVAFRADGFAKLFALLFSGIWLLAAAFAYEYMAKEHGEARFYRFFLLTLAAMTGASYARNLLTFFLCFEAMTLLSLPLVLHEETDAARKAGLMYLGYSIFGACLVLVGFFLLNARAGVTEFTPGGVPEISAMAGEAVLIYFLMALGFGAKAGMLPLHAWLPVAHPVAPSPASAVLSGLITKCGLLGILRLTYFLFGASFLSGTWAQTALLALALATVFMGSMMAYREKVFKKRLAYSTVSQVSYALFGIFLMNEAGLTGAMLQVIFHAVSKNCLFLFAGAVMMQTGITRVDDMRGIGRRMPVATWCFAIASLSLIGIPPFGGFYSKWALATAALPSPAGVWGACVLILSALLTAGYLLPIAAAGFFPGKDFAEGPRCEAGSLATGSLCALAALCVLPVAALGPIGAFLQATVSMLF